MNPIHSLLSVLTTCCVGLGTHAAEQRLISPDGKLAVIVSAESGLRYRVEVDGQPLVKPSPLGLEFAGGVSLGPAAMIEKAETTDHDGVWENRFGKRRAVRDRWWLAAMNGDAPAELRVPLTFLSAGQWTLRSFADTADSAEKPTIVAETTRRVSATDTLDLHLAPAGGFAGVLVPSGE